ncbi:MAG TPA: hypothetical protein VEQ65_08010, partial [Opitutus sp.]|nr:hypothetical protein [Opitutus sp.]
AAATGAWLWLGCSQRAGASIASLWVASLLPTAALDLPRVRVNERHGERLVALSEGAHGITAVVEREGSRRLKLNNHYALGGTAATGDERMQAHLPLLRHPAPRSVAFLGLGTGITAGGALSHPVERLVAVELVPEVIAAARIHFSDANAGVTENGLAEIVADDARHHLRRTSERFAVIVGDLVVPWRQGEGALFTLEQFRAARDALAPNGLFCQWVPLFQLSAEETMILVRTFLRVFPKAEIWRGDFSPFEPAIALIGTADGRGVDAAQIGRRLAEMKRDPANPHLTAGGALWMYFVGEIEEADLGTEDFRINREDRPWIELLAPLRHGGARGATLFTGRQLEAWLDVVRRRSQATIERLPPTDAAAVAAGEALADWTLSTMENDSGRADAARERMKTLLPTETFEQLFPQR